MRLHTAGVISSVGRASPLHGGGRRFEPVITHHFGSLAQLVEQLTFNQLVAGSNPARPTNVERRPKGAFLLCAIREGFEPAAGRVERRETALPEATTRQGKAEPSHPARPTHVERRPKGAFLLSAICEFFFASQRLHEFKAYRLAFADRVVLSSQKFQHYLFKIAKI